jgi:hypothetical protein
MCERLDRVRGVDCVYQIGYVATPGISDVDLLVVFDDEARYVHQLRDGLASDDSYVFVHNLFGITRNHHAEARRHTFFHNYRLLAGMKPPATPPVLLPSAVTELQTQTALEYLVKMFATLSAELLSGVVKLRTLFLRANALRFDCEFLGLEGSPFHESVLALIRRRENWFRTGDADERAVREEIETLHARLHDALACQLGRHPFYAQPRPGYRVATSSFLVDGPRLELRHGGIPETHPLFASQHDLHGGRVGTRLEVALPLTTSDIPASISRWFELRSQMAATNRARFPHFLTLSSSLRFR